MPFDGTEYQPEQSLELRALRHALAFFSNESKWVRFKQGSLSEDRMCVGQAIVSGARELELDPCRFAKPLGDVGRLFVDRALGLGLGCTVKFNDYECPNFAALQAHLRARIAYYEDQRMSAYAKASVKVAA